MDPSEVRSALKAAGWILAFLVVVEIIYAAPTSILALGLVNGSLSALIAVGLVLVYRANRIVNFAQFDIGGSVAILTALLIGKGMPFFLAVAIGMVTAVGIGALIEVLFIRRFAKAPRLQLTVATIGIAQIFQVIELLLPKVFNFDNVPQPPQPFTWSHEWFPVTFQAGHLLILIVVPAVAAGLAMFLRRSRFGIGIRAAAESSDRAALLGIPVKRLNTLVWMLASGLSGLAVLLRMPIQGVAVGALFDVSLLLRALTAAVIGRMENLPRTIAAGLVLGMVSEAVFFGSHNTIVADAVLFAVIVGALLIQRRGGEDRARDIGTSTWRAIREVRPIPRELMRLPEMRIGLAALGALAALLVVFVPLTMTKSQVNLLSVGLIFAIVMCSLVLLTGWAGQISLGQLAIMATGGAVAWTLALQGKDFFVCVGAAGLTGTVVAVALGIPALRIKGPFLAVTTLAFAVTTGTFFLNNEYFPWLVPSVQDRLPSRPVIFDKFNLESDYTYYYVILLTLVLVIASVSRMRRSRTGRTLIATRDNTRAAQSYGISPVRAQLTAFAFSGFIAGIAGGLYLFHQHQLSSTIRDPSQNILVFSIGVLGGLGSIGGALIAAGYLYFVNYSPFTRTQQARLFASGVGLLLIMLVRPDGLGGAFYAARDAVLRRIAKARGIIVPSLLADVRVDEDEVPLLDEVEADAPPAALAPGWTAQLEAGPPPDDALLVVRGLEVAYDKAKVLFGVDFHVSRGEIVALLGTNGAGKSTLLSAVCGLVKPAAGTVMFDGEDITGAKTTDTVTKGISLMPGGKGVFPTLTVAENLQLAGWLYADDPEYVRTATEQVLEFFPILRERWDQRAGNLSGGEQQMLTLGAGLPRQAEAADDRRAEPRPGADHRRAAARHRAGDPRQRHHGRARRAVGQRRDHARRASGVPREGRGPLQRTDRRAARAARAAARRVPRRRRHQAHREARRARRRNGTATSERPATRAATPTSWRWSCEGDLGVLRRHPRGGRRELQRSTKGQIVGMIGPNGAGKTTVLDIISGLRDAERRPRSCPAAARTSPPLPPSQRALLGLGRSFQDARLFPSMTVRDTIATAYERHVSVPDPLAAFLLSPAVKVSEREGRRRGRPAHRADAARGVRRQVRRRAVDRHAAHRRPRVHARAQAVGAAARRAVLRHRPARDRGARAGAARHPRQDRSRA